jgi:error-prone DNA polymerase
LVNAQPMGFYQPAQIVRDARDHGVEVRPVCINASEWDCTLEPSSSPPHASHREEYLPLRLGMRIVKGLSETHVEQILAARAARPFASVEDVWRRSNVPAAALEKLANADAFLSLGFSRRQALWQVRGLGERPLPLFAAADEAGREPEAKLRPMAEGREVVEDYGAVRLSLRAHPLAFLRPKLDNMGIIPCAELARVRNGSRVEVAGVVLIRQRPGSTNVTFITIEDETGIANAILWQRKFQAQRRIVMTAAMIGVKGMVQKEGDVIHIVADRLEDYTPLLDSVGGLKFPHRRGRADAATGSAPDQRETQKGRGLSHAPSRTDSPETIRVKSRNFH